VVDHLATHVVVDLTLRAFPVGRTVATLCGHVSVWLTRLGETAFEIVAPRSVAADLHGELTGHP
jgi:heterotetrameric sarcosine oxidase gamma subunit